MEFCIRDSDKKKEFLKVFVIAVAMFFHGFWLNGSLKNERKRRPVRRLFLCDYTWFNLLSNQPSSRSNI